MIRVTVIVEGPTEEIFVKGALAQALWPRQIYVTPIILGPALRPDVRLIPYLSLHEYEALLFSDPEVLAQAVERPSLASRFLDAGRHR